MSNFDDYIKYRVLHRKFNSPELISFREEAEEAYKDYREEQESILEELEDAISPDREKNVCFKTSAEFNDEIEEVCDTLDIRKRDFLARAVADALNRAQEQINEILKEEK